MGFSKLKIPRVCEQCQKAFEAKTITTRFCSKSCANKSVKEKAKLAKGKENTQKLLEQSTLKIAQIQTRPFISVSEATVLFGISKDTIHRLIKAGQIPAANLGQRLTRVSRSHIELLFSVVDLPKEKAEAPVKVYYEINECYTLSEVSEKFNVNPSTVSSILRRFSIPKRQVGNYVYVPRVLIDKILQK